MIYIKRAYDPTGPEDGFRILIDRLWPRGLSREALKMDGWQKEVAPSDGLRRWFGHDPTKWDEFCRRYYEELNGKPEAWQPIIAAAQRGNVTLLFGAKDVEHSNAVALKSYLEKHLGKG